MLSLFSSLQSNDSSLLQLLQRTVPIDNNVWPIAKIADLTFIGYHDKIHTVNLLFNTGKNEC